MRFTDMADEMFGAAQGALPAGVRLATAKRGGVTITRVEIARDGMSRWKCPASACWTSGTLR